MFSFSTLNSDSKKQKNVYLHIWSTRKADFNNFRTNLSYEEINESSLLFKDVAYNKENDWEIIVPMKYLDEVEINDNVHQIISNHTKGVGLIEEISHPRKINWVVEYNANLEYIGKWTSLLSPHTEYSITWAFSSKTVINIERILDMLDK